MTHATSHQEPAAIPLLYKAAGFATPARVLFDNETEPDYSNYLTPALRAAIFNDDRWGDPDDPDTGEKPCGFNKTLAVLWDEAGRPSEDDTSSHTLYADLV